MSKVLDDQRHEFLVEANLIIENAKLEARDLSTDEAAECDRLLKEAGKIKRDPGWQEWCDEPASRISSPCSLTGGSYPPHNPNSFLSPNPSGQLSKGLASAGPSFRAMFGPPHGNDGFNSLGEYLETVGSGLNDPRLTGPQATAMESTGGGGFLVPDQFAEAMLDTALEAEIVRPRATTFPMTSDTLKIPGRDGQDHTTNLFGGFTATWIEEAGTPDVEDPKVRHLKLVAKKLFLLGRASSELSSDAISFEKRLGGAMVSALAWWLDYYFLRGSGSGQPLGVLGDSALVVVAKESGQAADTITYTNVVKMLSRLHPSCVTNSVWVANPTTIPALLTLSVPIGTSGSHVPMMQESGGKYTMLTRPVLISEKLPAVGDEGDILLADFSQYAIGMRRELSVERSAHAGFTSDTIYYRCVPRVDGRGMWNEAVTPNSGSTLGWAVALAER